MDNESKYDDIIKQGYLWKRQDYFSLSPSRKWKLRFFVLTKVNLLVYRSQEKVCLKQDIHLEDLVSFGRDYERVSSERRGIYLDVKTTKSRWHLRAQNNEVADDWMKMIVRTATVWRRRQELFSDFRSASFTVTAGFESRSEFKFNNITGSLQHIPSLPFMHTCYIDNGKNQRNTNYNSDGLDIKHKAELDTDGGMRPLKSHLKRSQKVQKKRRFMKTGDIEAICCSNISDIYVKGKPVCGIKAVHYKNDCKKKNCIEKLQAQQNSMLENKSFQEIRKHNSKEENVENEDLNRTQSEDLYLKSSSSNWFLLDRNQVTSRSVPRLGTRDIFSYRNTDGGVGVHGSAYSHLINKDRLHDKYLCEYKPAFNMDI